MSPSVRAAFLLLTSAAAATAAEVGAGLPKNSPFIPSATAAAPAAAANENIEFVGVSSIGKKTDLIFYDKAAKKNHWIGVGESKDGITVVSHDADRDQAAVKVNGVEKFLPLRKGVRPAAPPRSVTTLPAASGFAIPSQPAAEFIQKIQPPPPTSAALPPAALVPATAATPEAQAQVKAETEARMLVSDLLEIGMAQRKAYEDAQKKAAENPTPSVPANEPPKP